MDLDTNKNQPFSSERLDRISQIEDWHFWFRGRLELTHQMLNANFCLPTYRILDLGCGSGKTIEKLTDQASFVVGIDQREEGLRRTHFHLPEAGLVQAMAERIPLNDGTIDGIFLLDLLEHTDDRQTIQEITRVLKPEGWAIISVPAFPFLWSYRDRAAGHYRRYTRQGLTKLVKEHLRVVQVKYYQFFLFPVLMATRILGKKGPFFRNLEENPLPVFNNLLTRICIFEANLSRWINFPCKLPNMHSIKVPRGSSITLTGSRFHEPTYLNGT